MKYEKMIDHTYLKPEGTEKEIDKLIQEPKECGFGAICINSSWIKHAKEKLKNTDIKIVSVVGFPLGACISQVKVQETKLAIDHGADEIDMVINIAAVKDKQNAVVRRDIAAVKKAIGDKILKVIIETCLLTDAEKVTACQLAESAGADFVKTSTGFSTGGAKVEDVALMRETVRKGVEVKASGGIKTLKDANAMLSAGASRLGCGQAGAKAIILEEKRK